MTTNKRAEYLRLHAEGGAVSWSRLAGSGSKIIRHQQSIRELIAARKDRRNIENTKKRQN